MLVVKDEGGALSRLWRGRSYACPNKQIRSVIYCVRRRWGSRPQRWRVNLAYRKTASALGSASLWPTVFSGRCDRGQHLTYRRALSTGFLMLNNDLHHARAARSVIHVIPPVSSSQLGTESMGRSSMAVAQFSSLQAEITFYTTRSYGS